MKRRMLSLLLTFVMVLGMLPTIAFAAPAESSGVYQIGTAEDLLWFAETVNGGETGISAVLTADIDLTGADWPGIGDYDSRFAGSFDGQGHTVTFKDTTWGLFGYVQGSSSAVATIQNVITAGSLQRSAIAHNAAYAHFTSCINRATITSTDSYVAGIVGKVSGIAVSGVSKSDVLITNCGNEASITGHDHIGGIVGWSQTNTRLDGCYNTGNIHGGANVGGLVGYLQEYTGTCEVKNSYNTGRVTGSSAVGGIIGNMYNGVSVANCYNAGPSTYAIAGNFYNNTYSITNSFFLGVNSAKSVPDFVYVEGKEVTGRATAKSAAEMASADFAALLGDAFIQSCPTPVLSWQTAVAHTGTTCANCSLGSTEKESYDVSFQAHDGYTLTGAEKATQGEAYKFTLAIHDGYEKDSHTFVVKANGETLTAASDGSYTVLNVSGPISITVFGVQVIPGSYAVKLPGSGNGYRVNGENTVARDEDYTFTVSFVEGFRAGSDFKVIAREVVEEGQTPEELTLTAVNGVYTIPAVQKTYQIIISGVEVVSSGVTATVHFSITEGEKEFHVAPNSEEILMDKTFTVPYFDLSLYGLERYYYNPYCYVDEYGNLRGIQQVGTPESAYDNITIMHALIVATELYYFEYDQAQVGTGASYRKDPAAFEAAISWTQDAGSSFMNFWDHGTNLNYYLNYEYPLGYPGWGATSDQILIETGDVISVHMITGNASGSRFGFFTDSSNTTGDVKDYAELDQGEKVELTLYWTNTAGNYDTGYDTVADRELYWIDEANATENVTDWNRTDFGKNTTAKLVTDSKGKITISTVGLEPGVYYIAALGGESAGGGVDNTGFVSKGMEIGPAVFKLIVNEYEGKVGDVNGDGVISANDATLIMRYVAKLISEINESVADVNGDGVISANDATLIKRYVAKLIDSFPAEQIS